MPRRYRKSRKSRRASRRGRRGGRVGAYLTRPRMTYGKRIQQNLTRQVVWFKRVQTISSDTAGKLGFLVQSDNVDTVDDFVTYATLYSQFKVLKIVVKFFPANVGGEGQQILSGGGIGLPQFQRGDCCTYTGTEFPGISSITDVINRSSSRLVAPRRYHKRWVDRPKGYYEWGELDSLGGVTEPDKWKEESGIHMYGENFTPVQAPGQQNFFYVMTLWKVIFRSKQD